LEFHEQSVYGRKKEMDERNKHWKDDTMKGGHYKTTTKFTFDEMFLLI
jgi:hypothetical protein